MIDMDTRPDTEPGFAEPVLSLPLWLPADDGVLPEDDGMPPQDERVPPEDDGMPTAVAVPLWLADVPLATESAPPVPTPTPTLPPSPPMPLGAEPEPEPASPAPLLLTKAASAAPDRSAPPISTAAAGSVDGPAGSGASGESADDPDLFGWDFEQPAPGSELWDNRPSFLRRNRVPLAIGVVGLAVLGVLGISMLSKDEPRKAPPPPPAAAPQSATPVGPERLAALQPRSVLLAPFQGRVQVTWDAPQDAADVVGYLVAAQTAAGELVDRPQLVENGEHIAVFTDRAAAPGTCFVVTTVVRGDTSVGLAKSEPACTAGRDGSGSPSTAKPSDKASEKASAPPATAPAAPPSGGAPSATAPVGDDSQMLPGTEGDEAPADPNA